MLKKNFKKNKEWSKLINLNKKKRILFIFRQLIEESVNGRDNTKLAQQKIQQYKTDFVKQYKQEIKQLMKQALEKVGIIFKQDKILKTFKRFFSKIKNRFPNSGNSLKAF